MYRDEETTISYKYLKEVIQHLDEPVCLIGGWAVYFTVTDNYKEETKKDYLGSRDIDLGFQKPATARKAISKLIEMGFKRISFRYFKEVHAETMKELSTEEAKKTAIHNIFPMYVDLIMSTTYPAMKTELGFMPIDEPLLQPVFAGQQKEITEFNRNVIVPTPEIMVAMKIRSLKGRDKEHKRIKDLCDLTALCLYSWMEIAEIKTKVHKFLTQKEIMDDLGCLTESDVGHVAEILSIDRGLISEVLEMLKSK
jgi:hypothetical protein